MMLFESKTTSVCSSSRRRRGAAAALILIGLVAAAILGTAFYYLLTQGDAKSQIDAILVEVKKGEFVSQVLDQGEVQSSENVEIRCEVRARNGSLSVIQVIPEGKMVKTGDFLVQLDSTSFEKELESQKISLASAKTTVIQADADLNVAIASKNEYIKGTFKQNMLMIKNEIADADSAIETAKQEKEQYEAVLKHSIKLAQKGFYTAQQKKSDEFAVEKAKLALLRGENSLLLAQTKETVLRDITYQKDIFQYDSDIEAAKVRLSNQEDTLRVEQGKLEEITEMIEKCRIVVPEGVQGQVVYAKESSRGGNDWVLEEGTTVRERQVLIRLPNPEKMEIKALINEQSITLIRPGMPTSIRVDALTGLTLKGIVTRVNQYAESSGWMGGSIRKYAVFVEIKNPPEDLKPGMNSSVTIQSLYKEDAVIAPIQTIYAVGDQAFCLIKMGEDKYETRELEISANNSTVVMIESGVVPGELLVMNPGVYKDLMDLPDAKTDEKIIVPGSKDFDSEDLAGPGSKQPSAPTSGENPGNDQRGLDGGSRRGGGAGGGQRAAGGGQRGGGGGGGGGFSVDMLVDRTMDRYDTNSDGNIDATEQKDFDGMASRLADADADADADGNISRDEIKTAMEKMMSQPRGGGQRGGPGGGQGGGRGGRGQ